MKRKRIFNNSDTNHIAPVIAAAPKIATAVSGIVKSLGLGDLGKITEGPVLRKMAAGINGLKSLGYSLDQIKCTPLRDVVDHASVYPMTIDTVMKKGDVIARNTLEEVRKLFGAIPAPAGNTSTYQNPGSNPTQVMQIIRSVYGSNFPDSNITPATFRQFPPTCVDLVADPSSRAQGLTQSGINVGDLAITQSIPTAQPAAAVSSTLNDLKQVAPAMRDGLLELGLVPESDIEGLSMQFYERVVRPNTNTWDSCDFLDESIADAIFSFLGSVAQRKKEGEQLPAVYDKIAATVIRTENAAKDVAVEKAQNKIGEWFTENVWLVVGGLVALVVIIFLVARKK